MKITKFLTLLFICAIFSCNHLATANFTLVVAPPPAYILDKAKTLAAGDEITKTQYTVKATIYTHANDTSIATQNATANEGQEATLVFNNITAQNDLYAFIEIGYQYPSDTNTGEQAKFEPIYSGCSDLFDVVNGETKNVSIVAVKNDRFGFSYNRSYLNADSLPIWFKYVKNVNGRTLQFDDIVLSNGKVNDNAEVKISNDTVPKGAPIVKALLINNDVYGICTSDNICYLFKVALSELENVAKSDGEKKITNTSIFLKLEPDNIVSNPNNYGISNFYQFGNYLCAYVCYSISDPTQPEQAASLYILDLSDTSDNKSLIVVHPMEGNEVGHYSFPFKNDDTLYLGIFTSYHDIAFYKYTATENNAVSPPAITYIWKKKGYASITGSTYYNNTYLVSPLNGGFIIFLGNAYTFITSSTLTAFLSSDDTSQNNLTATAFFSNDADCGVFKDIGLVNKKDGNGANHWTFLDRLGFEYVNSCRYGDYYYVVSSVGLFIFKGAKSGNLTLANRYLCLDLHTGYIWQNNFYAFCSNDDVKDVSYIFKKDLLKLTTAGKLPKLTTSRDQWVITLSCPGGAGSDTPTFFDWFEDSVNGDDGRAFKKFNCYRLKDSTEFKLEANPDGKYTCNLTTEGEEAEYYMEMPSLDVDFVLRHEGWDDSEIITETVNYSI